MRYNRIVKKAVAFVAFNRENYFKDTVISWKKATENFQDWDYYFFLEPSENVKQMQKIIKLYFHRWPNVNIIVNDRIFGNSLNIFSSIDTLFKKGYSFVISAEDDAIVSNDILYFFQDAIGLFEDDDDALTIQGNIFTKITEEEYLLVQSQEFIPRVWGTWKSRWDNIIKHEWIFYDHLNPFPENWNGPGGWDLGIDKILKQKNKNTVSPSKGRVAHIGEIGTYSAGFNHWQKEEAGELRESFKIKNFKILSDPDQT